MNVFKRSRSLAFTLATILAGAACTHSGAESRSGSGTALGSAAVSEVQSARMVAQQVSYSMVKASGTPVETQLANAKKAKKAVFLVVTGNGVTKTAQALAVAKEAQVLYPNSVVVEMNRDDAANAALVAEWRLASAPLPLILVISTKGQPAGGYVLQQATPQNLAALVPSPKLELIYEAVGSGKHVILALTKKSFSDRKAVLSECQKAVALLNREAVVVEVDMDDLQEVTLMQKLGVNPAVAQSSVTLVINKQGQVAGQSTSIPDAEKLAKAATTPVKKGCGPGCGPAGCGKQ